jgi:hypothetical protein
MTIDGLSVLYQQLPGPAASLYRLMGACAVTWYDGAALSKLTGLAAPAGDRLADVLVQAGMAIARDGGYALGPVVHVHARILAEECGDEERRLNDAACDRVYGFYADAAGAAQRLITPSRRGLWKDQLAFDPAVAAPFALEERAALDWLELRLPTYMQVINAAFAEERYSLCCELAHRLWPLWLRRGHRAEREQALTLALASARLVRSDSAIGQMLTMLAGTVREQDPLSAYGYNRQAAALYAEIGDGLGMAQAINGIAKSLLQAGDPVRAGGCFRDAEQLRADAGYMRGAALSRQGRGRAALASGRPADAARLLWDARCDLLAESDHYDAAMTLVYHAEARALLGDFDGALGELEAASATLRESASTGGEGLIAQIKARILGDARQAPRTRSEGDDAHGCEAG